jgi:hypothetical protein
MDGQKWSFNILLAARKICDDKMKDLHELIKVKNSHLLVVGKLFH